MKWDIICVYIHIFLMRGRNNIKQEDGSKWGSTNLFDDKAPLELANLFFVALEHPQNGPLICLLSSLHYLFLTLMLFLLLLLLLHASLKWDLSCINPTSICVCIFVCVHIYLYVLVYIYIFVFVKRNNSAWCMVILLWVIVIFYFFIGRIPYLFFLIEGLKEQTDNIRETK